MLLRYTLLLSIASRMANKLSLSKQENEVTREGGEIIHKINTLAHSSKLPSVEKKI
jgi:hypothetical protein